MAQPVIYLHDESGRRIGAFSTVSSQNRSYTIGGGKQVAQFVIAEDDPLTPELHPSRGRAVAISSSLYPHPWVGRIARVRHRRKAAELEVSVLSYETVLAHRFLPDLATFSGAVGRVIEDMLQLVNDGNDTGITVGAVGTQLGSITDASFHRQSFLSALDSLAAIVGAEWWVDVAAGPGGIEVLLSAAPHRGEDLFDTVSLVDGANVTWTDWAMDGEAATFRQRLVGGRAHAVQPPNSTPAGVAVLGTVAVDSAHGFPRESGIDVETPLTRAEAFDVVEHLRDTGQVQQAAALFLSGARAGVYRTVTLESYAEGVIGGNAALTPPASSTWHLLRPGDIVRLEAPAPLFFDGFRGPVRILGLQPDEESGAMGIVVEVRREKQSSAVVATL